MAKQPEANVEATNIDDFASTIVQENPKKQWQSYIWDSLGKSPEERHFVFKLDLAVLTFGCLGFFIKFLDQAKITNAFVSGMKEDLDMFGNELNYVTTAWMVGYIVGEIPGNIIMTRIRPSIWLPSLEIIWTVLTMCLAACQNTTQLYALRFFISLMEGGFNPGINYMIGSCLGGTGGLAGWKWLFIMDGVISFPVAIASFFFLPDSPETNRGWFFSKDELALAKKRMVLEGRRQKEPYTLAKAQKIVSSWQIYGLSLLYFCNGGTSGTPIFNQYLKLHKNPEYSLSQINNYPSATAAMQVFAALAYAWISDSILGGRRWPVLVFGAIINIILFSSLAVWNIAEGWKWACYILIGQGVGLPGIVMSWANEICSDDSEERAIVLATMNMMVNVMGAWIPLLAWQQVDAPRYNKGFILGTCLSVAAVPVVVTLRSLQIREFRRRKERGDEVTAISVVDSRPESDVGGDEKALRKTEQI